MKSKLTVLIIDEERAVRRLVRVVLEHEHYKVIEAATGRIGLKAAIEQRPDVIILELDLPDISGLAVLRHIRERSRAPVLILSERDKVQDKVGAFDGGADDYLTKPFDTAELLARLRVIRRSLPGMPENSVLVEGGLRIDVASHEITFNGQKLDFTPTEEALLHSLARHAGTVVSCKDLVLRVWGPDADHKIHDLRVYIAHIRRKLAAYREEILIRTEGSVGYCLSLSNRHEHAGVAFAF
ncbi:MAG TPA: response regulator transcription factor [Candidatus Baltobacteraceae bacterium]|jgi:two-component system KDP operon response regulator KdpE|nr:response regulator transcription factor [Candidatus Baltobacteraceae bacterium]